MNNEQKSVSLDEVIQLAVKTGVQAAFEYSNKEKSERLRKKYDRRLHNTKLLLKEYRTFKAHVKGAVYKSSDLRPIDILDELDDDFITGQAYVESIKSSTERTLVIVEHIDTMLEVFREICQRSKKLEQVRRCNIIFDMYINGDVTNIEEVARKYSIDIRTVYRDIDKVLPTLTVLFFGVDGLKT